MSVTAHTTTITQQHSETLGDIELRAVGVTAEDTSREDESDNEPNGLTRANILKIVVAGFSYFFAGTSDGSLGALTPYIIRTYHVGTQYVAIMYEKSDPTYAASFLGWLFTAATNSHVSRYLGLGTILAVGAVLQLMAHVLRFWDPPFGLFIVTFFLQAVGMAYQDSHANTFVASIKGAHRWLSFIHAMYALGCLVSPFVATAVASKVQDRWPLFYLFLVGIGSINLIAVLLTFKDTLKIHPRTNAGEENEPTSRSKNANKDVIDTLKSAPVYLLSMFYFFMLGVGITAGGWLVQYLVSARNGKLPDVGYIPAGLWGGIFLGRVLLAEPTHRFGERRMTMMYCVLILALQLVFWLVPNLISSTVAICFLGFFFGPMFAAGMSIASRLFEKRIQPTALGLVFVLAQAGGSLFPALTGVIASKAGVEVMQPMLVGLIVAMGISWALVPRVKQRNE